MPFQVPAGHSIWYVAPSGSVPLTVVTEPEPPQLDDAADAAPAGARGEPAGGQARGEHQPGYFLRPHHQPHAPQRS